MNFENVLNKLKNEPEWAVLIGLLLMLAVGGSTYLYYRYENRSKQAQRNFRQASTLYFQASRSGNYNRAVNSLERFINNHPEAVQSDKARFFLGKSYYETDRMIQAIKQFKNLLKTFPDSLFAGSARLHIGYANFKRNHLKKARNAFRIAAKNYSNEPIEPEARWQQALVNLELGNDNQANQALKKLIQSSKKEDAFWTDWARRLRNQINTET